MAVPNITGIWLKDKKASDSMDDMCTAMNLSFLFKQAVNLMKGIEITQDDATLVVCSISLVNWFQVKETYRMDGTPGETKRRDLRKGKTQASIKVIPPSPEYPGGAIDMATEWGEPYAGFGNDVFSLQDQNTLIVIAPGPSGTNPSSTKTSTTGSSSSEVVGASGVHVVMDV
eukprot:CAMPEP_0202891962 /NCGR_PEP_ID=MMETSP1392-20130828/1857_1 /ASSEMBLY_ACC=CAM_ASM_000868 /TAXON_ID=225041 /ORGANISM="Chlamydomonas chlamydogama, Strain SAG 11-48b" /LENGTH=171 /DNA_ID=CAMNT_0049575837 /DNA_START=113 /DNA_END=629 /DNA_ORIENTATION=-